jgi:PAS domain S-box-containing protein
MRREIEPRAPRILIVEDERIVARDLQVTLDRAGYEVAAAVASGEEAIRAAAACHPDLILMDIVLHGEITGIEAARRIRERREIPVVYLTANGDRMYVDAAKSTAPIAYLLKPYLEQDLLTTLEVTLHQYREHQDRAREALRQSEIRYRELFETARDGIATLDLAGRHTDGNAAYLNLAGCATVDAVCRLNMSELMPDEFKPALASATVVEELERGYSDEFEAAFQRDGGRRIPVSVRVWLRRDLSGASQGFWIIVRDISERKQAEGRILEYQAQLQSLMADLAVAEEKERQRIATDIHDRISQTLAVCQMRLEGLSQGGEATALGAELQGVCGLIDRTIRETSSLVFELCPPVLHQLGLAPALEWFGEKIQREHGLSVEVRCEAEGLNLDADCRNALFRSACELANNVVKHARARRVWLRLQATGGILRLIVEDDGCGIDSEAGKKTGRGGFGMFHVRERMRAWGGSLELEFQPGTGTRATLSVELRRANKQREKS